MTTYKLISIYTTSALLPLLLLNIRELPICDTLLSRRERFGVFAIATQTILYVTYTHTVLMLFVTFVLSTAAGNNAAIVSAVWHCLFYWSPPEMCVEYSKHLSRGRKTIKTTSYVVLVNRFSLHINCMIAANARRSQCCLRPPNGLQRIRMTAQKSCKHRATMRRLNDDHRIGQKSNQTICSTKVVMYLLWLQVWVWAKQQ